MDLGLTGKVALITGGSEGIGLACARQLAAEGARVVIAARRLDVLDAAAAGLKQDGADVLAVQADVMSATDVARLIDQAVAHFGQLDIVVNNAGTGHAAAFDAVTDEAWEHDLQLKLVAAARVARLALPHLRAQGGGRIVNITTSGAKQPAARSMPSSVSRAAGIALTKALSKELAADKILVNTVCVGLHRSAQQERVAALRGLSVQAHYEALARPVPLGHVGEAEDVARAVTFLVSAAAAYITGASLNVDGGLSGAV